MRLAPARLYAAALIVTTLAAPAAAWTAEDAAALSAARTGDMTRLAVHDAPRGPYEAAFAGPDGETATLSDWPGKVVLVNFWATWCPPCLKEMPAIDRLAAAMEGPDFEVVAISTDRGARDKPARWFAENGIGTLELYHDARMETARAAGLLGQPTTLILDRRGREIARYQGEAEWDGEAAVAVIEAAIAATD